MKNRLVIFDCFGVIFDEIAPQLIKKYLPGRYTDSLKDKIFVPADLGQINLDELFDRMAAEFEADRDDVIADWNNLIKLNEDIVPIIKKIKETADVALLSNAPLGFVEKLFTEHCLTPLFDEMVISCNISMAKPDPEIYRYCVSRFNRAYDEIYMIDDNTANLAAAESTGLIPIHFTDNSCLSHLT